MSIFHKKSASLAELVGNPDGTVGVSVNGIAVDINTALNHRNIEVRRVALAATRANRDLTARRALQMLDALHIGD